MTEYIERPCIDCGEMTCNDERCRDCDHDHIIIGGSCRECGRWLVAEEINGKRFGGPIHEQHYPGCSLAQVGDCYPRNAEEMEATRRLRARPIETVH